MDCERQVPYAVMNYRTLVSEDFFFVDHTRYLRELEKYQTPVFLRPKQSFSMEKAKRIAPSHHHRPIPTLATIPFTSKSAKRATMN